MFKVCGVEKVQSVWCSKGGGVGGLGGVFDIDSSTRRYSNKRKNAIKIGRKLEKIGSIY